MTNKDKIDPNKIPMPPTPDKVDLFLPITFWSEILMSLDRKTQVLSKEYGFGEVNMKLIVHNGTVVEVVFNDMIRMKGLSKTSDRPRPHVVEKKEGKTHLDKE
jgi:hypothetical protein